MLLDTNALLLPVRSRFPLIPEIERWLPGAHVGVPSSALDELTRLVKEGVRGARAALSLAHRYPIVPAHGRGDAGVLDAAARCKAWVVTADRTLAERLHLAGVAVLVPRDRHRLELHPGLPPNDPVLLPSPADRAPRRRQRL